MKGFFVFGTPALTITLKEKQIDVLLDTGFSGELMLPQALIETLNLEQIGVSDYLMASGEGRMTNVYKGRVHFLDEDREGIILSTDADFSLAGMELFHNCRIVIERYKRNVEITKGK